MTQITPRWRQGDGNAVVQTPRWRQKCGIGTSGLEELLQSAELALPTHDSHVRPVLVVHRGEGQDHPPPPRGRLELDGRRHLSGPDPGHEGALLAVGQTARSN